MSFLYMEQYNVSPLNCVEHLMEQKNHKTYIFGVKNRDKDSRNGFLL